MSIFLMIADIKKYINNCPIDSMKIEAARDFLFAVQEIRKEGYTWGQKHHLPFKEKYVRDLCEEDAARLLNIIKKSL